MTPQEIDAYTKTLQPSEHLIDAYRDRNSHERGYYLQTNRDIIKYFALEEEGIEKTLARIRSKRAWRFEFNTPLDACLTHAYYIQCCILEQRGLVRRLPEGNAAVRFIPC